MTNLNSHHTLGGFRFSLFPLGPVLSSRPPNLGWRITPVRLKNQFYLIIGLKANVMYALPKDYQWWILGSCGSIVMCNSIEPRVLSDCSKAILVTTESMKWYKRNLNTAIWHWKMLNFKYHIPHLSSFFKNSG